MALLVDNLKIYNTDRLGFRRVQPADFEMVCKWENDSRNWLQSGVTKAYGTDEIRQYVSRPESLIKDGQTRFVLTLENNLIVGCIDLFDFEKVAKRATVGILIDEHFRLQGYAFEALEGLAQIAKPGFDLTELQALVLSENKASVRLFKKAGYSKDVTKTTTYVYNNCDYKRIRYYKKL